MNQILLRLGSLGMQKVLLLGALVGGGYYFLLFDNGATLDARIATATQELEEEQKKISETNQALKEVEQVRASVGTLTEQLKAVSAQLPSELQMSEVIRIVDQATQMSGISLKSKEPKAPVAEGSAEGLPISLHAEGTYSEIGAFLYALGKTERLIKVKKIVLSGSTDFHKSTKVVMDTDVASYRFIGKDLTKEKKTMMKLALLVFLFSQFAIAQSENFVYDPTGRRDPFLPAKSVLKGLDVKNDGPKPLDDGTKVEQTPVDPLLAYALKDYKLMAILWDVKTPKALVQAPNGKVYTVLNKAKLGREEATIERIKEQEVLFNVPSQDPDDKKGESRVIYLRH